MPSPDLPPRQVTLLLCRGTEVLGTLPPFRVEIPFAPEVADVVAGARDSYGTEVTVLRLLRTEGGVGTAGGDVTYLAEVSEPPTDVALAPWPPGAPDPLAEHPLRLPYARPGGPAADVAWADEQLAVAGRPRIGPAVQVRTWNLSSIWRLPTDGGPTWLKVVPPFFAHEGAMLRRLDSGAVPPLVAAEGPRVLLEDVAGDDHWQAPLPVLLRVLEMLVGLQQAWVGRVHELEEVGAPDWRAGPFIPAVEGLLGRHEHELTEPDVGVLRGLVGGLPDRFGAVAECGVPDSLVHGDFHPGNARGSNETGGRSVLLDWGDCGIGNPLLDQAAMLASVDEEHREPLRERWTSLWQDAVPGSEPRRAAELTAPVAALRQALIYRTFLDGIEPDERVYHRDDPAHWLRKAAELARAEAA